MKTPVKTTIKGSENLNVTDSVQQIFDKLCDKSSFILLTKIGFDNKQYLIGIKKASIKMFG